MPQPTFTDIQARQLAKEYASGLSLQQLAERHGSTASTVKNTLIRIGAWEPRRRGQVERIWTAVEVDDMVQRYQSGQSMLAIGRALGTHVLQVRRELQLRGIDTATRRQQGDGHHNWKGGTQYRQGYRLVRIHPSDPLFIMAHSNGYVLEHRLVMARTLGRALTRREQVHHIDGNRSNNVPSNLQLRQGHHGPGWVAQCMDCGSHNIGAAALATA